METHSIDELAANKNNPRTISRHDLDALKNSIRKFGDLSGIVKNIRSGQLVGGHQRITAFKQLPGEKKIVITSRFEQPDSKGTVAIGFIDFENAQYGYREVDWDEGFEKAANIAANRIEGDWDKELLAQMNLEIAKLENGMELLADTGQREDEIKQLGKLIGVVDDDPEEEVDPDLPENNKLEFALTREQKEIVIEALENIKATRDMASEQNSSMYGNALYYMSREHLDRLHGLIENETPSTTSTIANPPVAPAQ